MKISEEQSYEKGGLGHRIKDLSILGAFTMLLAVISVIVMDIIIYPTAAFALSKTELFTKLFKGGVLVFIVLTVATAIVKRVRTHKKNGMPTAAIAVDLLKAPSKFLLLALFLLIISAVIIMFLWLLLSSNNNFIHYIVQ